MIHIWFVCDRYRRPAGHRQVPSHTHRMKKNTIEKYKKTNTVNNVAKESSLSLMCGAHALNIVLIEKSGESFQTFKTLGFKDVHDSFRQNELICNFIERFAPI